MVSGSCLNSSMSRTLSFTNPRGWQRAYPEACPGSHAFSAVAASGAIAKSMNFAGVFVMSETRHLTRRSRGLVFLALAIRTPSVPLALTTRF
jgi:hypothetical protein